MLVLCLSQEGEIRRIYHCNLQQLSNIDEKVHGKTHDIRKVELETIVFYHGSFEIHANGWRVVKATCIKYGACQQKWGASVRCGRPTASK